MLEIILAIYAATSTIVIAKWRSKVDNSNLLQDECEELHRQIGLYQDIVSDLQSSYDKVYAVAEKAKREKKELESKILDIPKMISGKK
jgi:translation initiation factor 2 alpha subunit (eIF-2alpha)